MLRQYLVNFAFKVSSCSSGNVENEVLVVKIKLKKKNGLKNGICFLKLDHMTDWNKAAVKANFANVLEAC